MDTIARDIPRVERSRSESGVQGVEGAERTDREIVRTRHTDSAAPSAVAGLLRALASRAPGWWPASRVREALGRFRTEDDNYYRAHFSHLHGETGLANYSDARAAYVIGHLAAFNPEYSGGGWDRVERDVATAWTDVAGDNWDDVRPLVRDAFRRASSADYQLWRGRLNDDE